MEEKLNELLEIAELNIIDFEYKLVSIDHKISFMSEHKFDRELEWLLYERTSLTALFQDYKKTVTDIREMLNKWQS